jgi:hypothetical protein
LQEEGKQIMATPAQDFQNRQMAADLAQSATFTQPAGPSTVFPADAEASLAASLNELKKKDVDYARLQSEESRATWENMARQNLARAQEAEAQRAGKIAADQAQSQAVDDARVMKLLEHAKELQAAIPQDKPLTEWNVPTEMLRDIANTSQELDRAARERGMPGLDGIMPQLPQAQPAAQHPDANSVKPHPRTSVSAIVRESVDVCQELRDLFGGDIPAFVMRRYGCDFPNALRQLGCCPDKPLTPAERQKLADEKHQREQQHANQVAKEEAERQRRLETREWLHLLERTYEESSNRLSQLRTGATEDVPGEEQLHWEILALGLDAIRKAEANYYRLAEVQQ